MWLFFSNLNHNEKQSMMECEDADDDSYVSIYRDIMTSHKLTVREQSLILHYLFLRSSGCICCVRHLTKKPRSIRKLAKRKVNIKQHSPSCNCSCRHVSRQICRVLGT